MPAAKRAECKLQVLYLVKNAPGVSYQALMNKCISGLFVDFFTFSEVYGELTAGDLIERKVEDTGTGEVLGMNETLMITEGGQAVLSDLLMTLNPQMKINLDRLAGELKLETQRLNSAKAFIEPSGDDRFTVKLYADGIEIKAAVATKEEADAVCHNWRSKSADIQKLIMDELLKI